MLPTFLGVGAARSGTTTLYELLRRRPDVFMAEPKEIHYFTYNHPEVAGERGMSRGDYESLFAGADGRAARGEISPSYLWVPRAAPRIKQLIPEAKIVVVLRNPIERAFSDYCYGRQQGARDLPFAEYIRRGANGLNSGQIPIRPFDPISILWKGFYFRHLRRFFKLFGGDRVRVLQFEDLAHDFGYFREELLNFLGVDASAGDEFAHENQANYDLALGDEERELLRQIYREDIERASDLLKTDLGYWLA